MIQFPFRVNASFKGYRSHPITVPRTRVNYFTLAGETGWKREGLLHLPDGTHVPVQLYWGTAGFGPYVQLRAKDWSAWASGVARIGDVVTVTIQRRNDGLTVSIDQSSREGTCPRSELGSGTRQH
jgi:hypothetical protein